MHHSLKILAAGLLGTTLTGCAFNYKGYETKVDPTVMKPYDLSQNAADAPVIYFDTMTFRDLGVPFHHLLLATQVDGQTLDGAGQTPWFDFSGYQAVKVTPGTHSLEWCWVGKSKLGTGGGRCELRADNVEFKAGQRYLVSWSTSNERIGYNQTYMAIHSRIQNFDSKEVVFQD